MAEQQFGGAVSKEVELGSPQGEPEPNRNKICSFHQGALKQGGLKPVLETVVRRTKRRIKTEASVGTRCAWQIRETTKGKIGEGQDR